MDDLCINHLSTGEVRRLFATPTVWESPLAWSRDDEWLLFLRSEFNGRPNDLYAYSFRSGQSREIIHSDPPGHCGAAFSPDSHFVAFTKLTGGRREVYVATFPQATQEKQVTTDGVVTELGAAGGTWRDPGGDAVG